MARMGSMYMERPAKKSMTRNQRRRRKLFEQRVMGVVMLVITAIFIWMCSTANEDCGAAIITGLMGIFLLFSKEVCIY